MGRDPAGGGTWWSPGDGGVTVHLQVAPGTRRSEVVGVRDGRLQLRVRAPAVEGQANDEVVRLLAGRFGVRPRAVSLLRGERGRRKTVWIAGPAAPPAGLG